jgi:hypothetical protein
VGCASQLFFAAHFQQVCQLETDVEMVLAGGFAATRHDDDVLDPDSIASSTSY